MPAGKELGSLVDWLAKQAEAPEVLAAPTMAVQVVLQGAHDMSKHVQLHIHLHVHTTMSSCTADAVVPGTGGSDSIPADGTTIVWPCVGILNLSRLKSCSSWQLFLSCLHGILPLSLLFGELMLRILYPISAVDRDVGVVCEIYYSPVARKNASVEATNPHFVLQIWLPADACAPYQPTTAWGGVNPRTVSIPTVVSTGPGRRRPASDTGQATSLVLHVLVASWLALGHGISLVIFGRSSSGTGSEYVCTAY